LGAWSGRCGPCAPFERTASGDRPPLNVCLQVNLSGEASKGGVEPDEVGALLEQCRAARPARARTHDPAGAVGDETEQRRPFRALRELRDRLATPDCPLDVLSMGMSDDLEAAILEGATQVRIGTAVFGARPVD
jgi:PLP dependent protein